MISVSAAMLDTRTADRSDALASERRAPLGDSVYAEIKALILDGEFKPGTKLGEEELAARFSISRTPLRAVLGRLADDGLVQIYARRGAFVANYGQQDILEILQIREVLEGLASRLAVLNIDGKTIGELKTLFSPGRVREMRKDFRKLAVADQKFHAVIVRCTRNKRLRDLMARFNDQMQMVRMRTITLPGRLDRSIREHQQLIEALAARDGPAAEDRARRHIRNVRRAVLANGDGTSSIKEKSA